MASGSRSGEIDPRDFIAPPFVTCPKCGRREFGVLTIYGDGFSRRCRACWNTQQSALPPLAKKLIYLDQFVISNLLYANSAASKSHGISKTVSPFWTQCLERLEVLRSLQLLLCPSSSAHDDESSIATHSSALRDTFRGLSSGVSFLDFDTIKRFQLVEHAADWIKGVPATHPSIASTTVLSENPHHWSDRFRIDVNLGNLPGYLDAVRAERDSVSSKLHDVFLRWKRNPSVTWDQWFEEEARALGPSLLKAYRNDLARRRDLAQGTLPFQFGDLIKNDREMLMEELTHQFQVAGLSRQEAYSTLIEFLLSPTLMDVPFNKIQASIFASLAKKSASQEKPPTKGFHTDVAVISCLLPYCDAMFLDTECWNYLRELKVSQRLTFSTRIFSVRNKEEFLGYLDEIAEGADQEHLSRVAEVYGTGRIERFNRLRRG